MESNRRPGRPRQSTEAQRRTTITLPESLIAAIDSNLGELVGVDSRNQWLIAAADAYLHHAADSAVAQDWRELRQQVQSAYERAIPELVRTTRAMDEDEDDAGLAMQHGRAGGVVGAFGDVLRWMDTAEMVNDALAHPVDYQE